MLGAFGATAADALITEISSQPTLPIAGAPFKFHVKVTTFGAPITVDQISSKVTGPQIQILFCLHQGSSSTAPVTLAFAVPVDGIPTGTYDVSLEALARDDVGPPCQTPVVVDTTTTVVVPAAAALTIAEFFNAPLGHYFQTGDAVEIAALDAGVFAGWERTGQSYHAYAPEVVTPGTPARPVCRYYGKPEFGLDTHFFSAFAGECAIIPIAFPNQWILESDGAYAIAIPNESTGACAPGTLPIYRLFNARPDVNHRYTTSLEIRQQMIDSGWIPEGYGTIGVAMCAEILN